MEYLPCQIKELWFAAFTWIYHISFTFQNKRIQILLKVNGLTLQALCIFGHETQGRYLHLKGNLKNYGIDL